MTEISYDVGAPIDGYGPGFFRIGSQVYHVAVVVSAAGVADWQGLDDPAPLLALAGHCDVVFVGTGAEMAHLPVAFRETLEEAGLGVEPMASPTACRSYNILLSEGRRVAAALLPV